MIERLTGPEGRRVLLRALATQKMVQGDGALTEAIAGRAELREFQRGEALIQAGGVDNGLFLILGGTCEIVVKGVRVATRTVNDVVGEMAAVVPTMPRSASVIATDRVVAAVLTEPQLTELGDRFPQVFRHIAALLAQKLEQRNDLVRATSERTRVFLISSAEALPIARAIHSALSHDPFDVIPWNEGVFRATSYTLQTLHDEVEKADFAIAVAHSDDVVASRGADWPAPRDNVIFELGLFMGKLGLDRAILMEPREDKVKLPSDLSGITTITYRFDPTSRDRQAMVAPACNQLRDYIIEKGPRRI